MTFKALLYECYARRGLIDVESKEQGIVPLKFFSPSGKSGALAFESNNKCSNKTVAKMQHLSTETYNNEQVSKVYSEFQVRHV